MGEASAEGIPDTPRRAECTCPAPRTEQETLEDLREALFCSHTVTRGSESVPAASRRITDLLLQNEELRSG
ncbi:hypothetical protein NQZ68_039156 [Dissostichus eleginoides]|nr:hypothetical protein NQZ68_039156 [Dissostichus eleginoides]